MLNSLISSLLSLCQGNTICYFFKRESCKFGVVTSLHEKVCDMIWIPGSNTPQFWLLWLHIKLQSEFKKPHKLWNYAYFVMLSSAY